MRDFDSESESSIGGFITVQAGSVYLEGSYFRRRALVCTSSQAHRSMLHLAGEQVLMLFTNVTFRCAQVTHLKCRPARVQGSTIGMTTQSGYTSVSINVIVIALRATQPRRLSWCYVLSRRYAACTSPLSNNIQPDLPRRRFLLRLGANFYHPCTRFCYMLHGPGPKRALQH